MSDLNVYLGTTSLTPGPRYEPAAPPPVEPSTVPAESRGEALQADQLVHWKPIYKEDGTGFVRLPAGQGQWLDLTPDEARAKGVKGVDAFFPPEKLVGTNNWTGTGLSTVQEGSSRRPTCDLMELFRSLPASDKGMFVVTATAEDGARRMDEQLQGRQGRTGNAAPTAFYTFDFDPTGKAGHVDSVLRGATAAEWDRLIRGE